MKRETLQRRTSEGQRRIQQAKEAERAVAEAERQKNIAFLQREVRPEIKRLKAELTAAADIGKTSLLFKISCTYENILYKAVEDYCKKNKLAYKDASRSGQDRWSDDGPLEDFYYQYIEITWV